MSIFQPLGYQSTGTVRTCLIRRVQGATIPSEQYVDLRYFYDSQNSRTPSLCAGIIGPPARIGKGKASTFQTRAVSSIIVPKSRHCSSGDKRTLESGDKIVEESEFIWGKHDDAIVIILFTVPGSFQRL
ncbi:hypothetical protein AFLA_004477 [Aspergillus flavus NRRL3357]|nr:hypothetical protein AFLA_004477 [Aspergillus flavus NRRL3357]